MSAYTVPDSLVHFAVELAETSGAIARRYFRTPITVETKADRSPVTIADKEVELALRRLIAERHPDHGVIGEEHERHQAGADFVWVIDPIDGTKSFITGRPMFGTLIALVREGVPVLGVIDHPALGERWVGAHGHPTTWNGAPVRARPCTSLPGAVLMTSSPHYYRGPAAEAYERLRSATSFVMYGTECMAYGLLAGGYVDIVTEAGMDIFDYLAAVAIVEGAGGRMTDWQGRPLGLTSGDQVLAVGDSALHETVASLLER